LTPRAFANELEGGGACDPQCIRERTGEGGLHPQCIRERTGGGKKYVPERPPPPRIKSAAAPFFAPLGQPWAFRGNFLLAQYAVPSCPRSGVLMPMHIPYPRSQPSQIRSDSCRASTTSIAIAPRIASLLSDSLVRAPSRTSATSGLSPVSVFVFADAEKQRVSAALPGCEGLCL
jgi:hypothetical protein